jgi:hypothetical protein
MMAMTDWSRSRVYRMIYVPVPMIRELAGGIEPGARTTILDDPRLGDLVYRAWSTRDEFLETAITELAMRHAGLRAPAGERLDIPMLERVREYLRAHLDTNVRVHELAALASMSRFQLTRQFQRRFGLPLNAQTYDRRRRMRCPIST